MQATISHPYFIERDTICYVNKTTTMILAISKIRFNLTLHELVSSHGTLRQRIYLSLSEILVVSIEGLVNGGRWKAFTAANYLDLMETHCFGNYSDTDLVDLLSNLKNLNLNWRTLSFL